MKSKKGLVRPHENLKLKLSSSARPMAPKLGRVVTEGKMALPIKPYDH